VDVDMDREHKPRRLGPALGLAALLVLGMLAMLTVVNAPAVSRLMDAVATR